MVDNKMCRICMTGENLTSIFSIMDGGKISDKINFVCGLSITPTDLFPKQICHQCLSSIIIASSIKRKSLETEKIFKEMLSEDVEYIDDKDTDEEDDSYLIEAKESLADRFLVYEENLEVENQPKMNYNLSDSSMKINNINHFNYNPDLKSFVESYLEKKPSLEIIKITDASCIKDIERVLAINDDLTHSKRQRQTFGSPQSRIAAKQKPLTIQPNSSRLLNALSGQRFGNVTVNRVASSSMNRKRSMLRK